ncbi:MAG: PhnD/SsuA/transferrin family substrate-binding protein [Cyanobacteriota bacterium]|nr:PhnD/SsuA/transferrin family substrate-binding protein [Cyanobacteriota bacterium]
MLYRRHILLGSLITLISLTSCSTAPRLPKGKLTIGVVAYGDATRSIEQYSQLVEYLSQQTNSVIELEPAFNERKALDQIARQAWSIVFAPSGLTAIAIDRHQYIPIFPTREGALARSVIVVKTDSTIQKLADLANQPMALGQPGSATGYYLPLYDLYGLTLAELRFAPTPKNGLEWVAAGEVTATALAKGEFDSLKTAFPNNSFRILHTSRPIPGGAVLLGPSVDRNQQDLIVKAMNDLPPNVVETIGYIPNSEVSDYQYLIDLIRKIKPIENQVTQKPAVLFLKK